MKVKRGTLVWALQKYAMIQMIICLSILIWMIVFDFFVPAAMLILTAQVLIAANLWLYLWWQQGE